MTLYFEKLKNLQQNAYAPYSKFLVASILVLEDNSEFQGVNVENASYGGTICAERSAFVHCISKHGEKNQYKELHLLAGDTSEFPMPCGLCRQFISEFVINSFTIYAYNNQGEYKTVTMDTLLPFAFSKKELD
jgi:cytidine deaminase